MTFITDFTKDLTKTVKDATPVYAAVGVTDLAAEKLRAARERAAARRADLSVDALLSRDASLATASR